MKKRRFTFIALFSLFFLIQAFGQTAIADSIFARYMKQAQTFAVNYPREKAYLHFDNTSYYLGDTIWFKAYVTLADQPVYSAISKPLYVELVDQAGHVADKQIIKLTKGEGTGQFVLPKTMFSGYYEVRAYTRWMLGFSEPQYFSRTFPIYKMTQGDQLERNITNYTLSESMEQRPFMTKDKLSLRFFPEGGQLVEGVESKIAFKAESNRAGDIQLSGAVYSKEGTELAKIETLHDGMGHFNYTPAAKPAVARVNFQGKEYKFDLPEALPSGYVMTVENGGGAIAVQVACNAATVRDTLAVFISHQGMPCAYQVIDCQPGTTQRFALRTRDLPTGVLQISLINHAGHTLCERFSFSYPRSPLNISVQGVRQIYTPYAPIRCELQLKDAAGTPVAGRMSVSIRDALRSDYLEYDNNMFTDLLFTSDLKGYIHQPGYYFSDMTPRKLEELDVLMLVHGWRKYDMEQLIGVTPFVPLQAPEQQLILNGQVKSTILKKPMKNINLSVAIKKEDAGFITGQTTTDEEGRFSIPLEDFVGTEEALIQTRKQNKKRNTDASIMLDRNFTPDLRPLAYEELNPQWKDLKEWQQRTEVFDSLYLDSISRLSGNYLLDEVTIKSKRKGQMSTTVSEQSVDAYYDVRRTVDKMRDEGKFVGTIPEFLEMMNDQFLWDRRTDTYTYRQKQMVFILDGKILSAIEKRMMMTEIDGLSSILICQGSKALSDDIIQNSKSTSISEATTDLGADDMDASSMYATDVETAADDAVGATGTANNTVGESILNDITKYVFVYLIPLPYHDVLNKNETAALGTRRTVLQGYTPILDYYSPAYPMKELYMDKKDQRRTLYWNPSVKTDENGKAVIECYNNQYSTPLIIQAETLTDDGRIGTVTYSTISEEK